MERRPIELWAERFPFAAILQAEDFTRLSHVLQFPVLEAGAVAYEQDGACHNSLMCIEGRTRITKSSSSGREMLLYTVQAGGTCVLTTQCLLSRTNFPAESVAESRTSLAAIPASWFYIFMAEMPAFRDFVIADDTKLLGTMFAFSARWPSPPWSRVSPAAFWSKPARRWWSHKLTSNSPPTSAASVSSSVAISANGNAPAGSRPTAARCE